MTTYTFTCLFLAVATLAVYWREWTAALRRVLGAQPQAEPPSAHTLLETLVAHVLSEDLVARHRALQLLAGYEGDEAIERLIALLKAGPEEVQHEVAQILLQRSDERVIPALFAFFEGNPSEHVLAAGPIQPRTPRPVQLVAPVEAVPSVAATTPAPATPAAAAPSKVVSIASAYRKRNRRLKSEIDRLERAVRLGCAPPAVAPEIARDYRICASRAHEAGLEDKMAWLESKDPHVRARLVSRLARESDALALPTLLGLLEKDESPYVRAVTASVLSRFPSANVRRALQTRLTDPHEDVRWNAAYSVGRIGGPDAVAPLREVMRSDPCQTVRQAAAKALEALQNADVRSAASLSGT